MATIQTVARALQTCRPGLNLPATRPRQGARIPLRIFFFCPGCARPLRPIAFVQYRCQTNSAGGQKTALKAAKRKQPPTPTMADLQKRIKAAIKGGFRTLHAAFTVKGLKALYRQNPGELALGLFILAVVVPGILAATIYFYFTYFQSPMFTRFPPPVAQYLRRALYYTNINPDPQLALKNYKKALELCEELKIDPFSDEVMGIKVQVAAWLEKIRNYDNSIEVLERLLGDCKKWIETMEKAAQEGTLPKMWQLAEKSLAQPASDKFSDESRPSDKASYVPKETIWHKRTRVLTAAVSLSVKLGHLYSDDHVLKQDRAHECLVWAVETAINELQRRSKEGVKDREGDWLSTDEIGGAIESLGHSYEAKSQFHLAVPLFFQALRLSQNKCHRAVLMNNLAAAFAQHPVLPALETPAKAMLEKPLASDEDSAEQVRASYLAAARRWAMNARQQATEPKGDQRTPECDEACAVSLCNLGTIARLTGDASEARRRFEEALSMSKKLELASGVAQAEDGLRALAT